MEAVDDSVDSHPNFAERLAAPSATPGGGAAAAQVALYAASLLRMVLGITLAKAPPEGSEELRLLDDEAQALAEAFRQHDIEDGWSDTGD